MSTPERVRPVMSEKAFICLLQVLEKCKKWGYTSVWINCRNEHWNYHMGGGIVAYPKRRYNDAPALWSLGYDPLEREVIGKGTCGNGLSHADQMQFEYVGKNYDSHYYRLIKGKWLTNEEINDIKGVR